VVNLDVAYVPTPKDIVRRMLQLASLRRGETLFDLGAGDGRIVIEAVRDFGARAVGVEIDPERITRIRERLKSTGTQAELIQADLFEVNLSSADVITMYLSPSANAKLAPKLKAELKVGTRVVSLDYVLPDWVPDREVEINTSGMERKLYLYRTT
jgi:16S rRNA A1518/A1519 N6-dimethyltransferase RsmA/KsgA/DIM1 with predicted DNA glycosylase/AP lyase activity